ncbi:MAG: hypothetical protein ACK480_04685 [Planctomycetota bacterium]
MARPATTANATRSNEFKHYATWLATIQVRMGRAKGSGAYEVTPIALVAID